MQHYREHYRELAGSRPTGLLPARESGNEVPRSKVQPTPIHQHAHTHMHPHLACTFLRISWSSEGLCKHRNAKQYGRNTETGKANRRTDTGGNGRAAIHVRRKTYGTHEPLSLTLGLVET